LKSRIAIFIVMAVIQPDMDRFAHASAPTTVGERMEIHDSGSGKLECHKEHLK
jgi:hypothetical protein